MKNMFTSTRDFIASASVLAYIIAIFVPTYIVNEAVLAQLKEIVLIIIAFYFGQKTVENKLLNGGK